MVGRRLAVKTSVGRYTQFLHSVRDEDLPLGIDIWVLAGPDVPRVLSDQGQLGLEWRVGNSWLLSLEGYLRDFDDVITENFGENPNDTADDFLKGRGRSYGVDLFAQRFRGSTTGWITVGWLKALRTFPDYRSADLANEIGFYNASPYHKAVGEQLSLEGSTIPGGYRAGNWPQIREVIYENFPKILTGELSVEEAMKRTDEGASKLLAQFAKTL